MIRYRTEYRINKKGAECFRTEDFEEARSRLQELSAKRPGIYTLQRREVRVDKLDRADRDWLGRINWSPWH